MCALECRLRAVEVSTPQADLAWLVRGQAGMRQVERLRLVAREERLAFAVVPTRRA
jgi:hypothetical protein